MSKRVGIVGAGVILFKGTWRDERIGQIRDVFCVPASELTQEQISKEELLASEIDWESPVEPGLPRASDTDMEGYKEALSEMETIIAEMNRKERASSCGQRLG